MPDTSTITESDVDVDAARELVATALIAFAADKSNRVDEGALALAMADNVRGWTHTTRLREFLEGVTR